MIADWSNEELLVTHMRSRTVGDISTEGLSVKDCGTEGFLIVDCYNKESFVIDALRVCWSQIAAVMGLLMILLVLVEDVYCW